MMQIRQHPIQSGLTYSKMNSTIMRALIVSPHMAVRHVAHRFTVCYH